jgi:hypothetical protein
MEQIRLFIDKVKWFFIFTLLSIVMCSIFGVLHDQLSYTVSHEYYTRFKFIQFGFQDLNLPHRLVIIFIGFLASWWMGIPIGLLSGLAGFIHKSPVQTKRLFLWSIPLMFLFTWAFSFGGLLFGYLKTTSFDLSTYTGWYIPEHLEAPRRFLCAGYMHNASYLGGALSIPLSWIFHLYMRNKPPKSDVL